MAINYKLVTATSDASSPDTVFTATAVATHVKSIRIANESGGALTYHLAVYDHSASIEVPITVPATSLPDDDVDVMVEPFNLQNSDYIKLYSSGAGVKVAITLAENTDVAGATTSDDLAEGVTNLYLTSAERTKLSGIATGAEVNQNAFSNVAVSGQTTVAADAKTDTLTLVAGTGVTLTTDAGADSITIAASTSSNSFETIVVAGQSNVVADSGTDTLTLVAGTGITLTTDAGADSVTITNSATGANAFGNVAVAGQTTVAADSTNDTLTIAAGTGISLTTDATTDTLTITNSVTAPNTFSTIEVSGQSPVVADSGSDTLTLVAGSNITLTTNATTDTITIAAAGGSGSPAGSTGQIQYNSGGAFAAEAALHYDATNNRLSVGGNTSPTGTITSRGAGTTTGVALRIEDSAATTRLEILDSGRFTLSSAAVSNTAAYSILEGAPTLLSGGFSLRRSDASHTLAAGNAQSTDTFFLVRTEAAPAVYATIMGLSASGQASPPATRWIGIHGSTAPTGAVFTMQGSKTNGGSGYTTLGNSEMAWKFSNFATDLLVCLGSGAFGIRNSAPTSTTTLTVRGQGTSTNNTLLVENSGGTARFTVRDDGGYAFAGGTVGAAQTGYTTFTNLTTDRTCDANATTVEELADILGTLIVDLKTKGIIAA